MPLTFATILPYASFAVAAYGAIVATAVALKQNRERLIIRGEIRFPSDELMIEVFNPSGRRMKVREAEVRYGVGPQGSSKVVDLPALSDVALEPGQGTLVRVPTAALIAGRRNEGLGRKDFSRVWIYITGYGAKAHYSPVDIDHRVITDPATRRSMDFVAADIIVGFKQAPSVLTDYSRMK